MDKHKVSAIREGMNEALQQVAEGAEVTIKVGNISYSKSGLRATVIVDEISESGLPARYKADWDEAVQMGLVKAEHFGVNTISRDAKYEVVGYDFKKRKNNILLQRQDNGKIYVTGMRHFYNPAFSKKKECACKENASLL